MLVLALAAIIEGTLREDLAWPLPTVLVTLAALVALPWRRTRPLLVIIVLSVITTGFSLAQAVAGLRPDALVTMGALIIVPYALFRWGSGRDRTIGAVLYALSTTISTALGGEGIAGLAAGVTFVGGACLVGVVRRDRVRGRAREIEAARGREREILARDLHDTVAHHVSAIAIRSQVARTAPEDPAHIVRALDVIDREAESALTEMRALVRTLRVTADRAPAPVLGDLRRLADAGPPRVSVHLDPSDAVVSGILASTLVRIAQESVTNARRHARGVTLIRVAVQIGRTAAHLEVRNNGSPGQVEPVSEPGHGITGMQERAALLGGTVTAGSQHEGGWVVNAHLPRGERS